MIAGPLPIRSNAMGVASLESTFFMRSPILDLGFMPGFRTASSGCLGSTYRSSKGQRDRQVRYLFSKVYLLGATPPSDYLVFATRASRSDVVRTTGPLRSIGSGSVSRHCAFGAYVAVRSHKKPLRLQQSGCSAPVSSA